MKPKTQNKHTARPAALAAMALALAFGPNPAQAAVTVGSIAPDFNIRNHATSQALRLYNYQGNIIVLDFWAYWCGPCQSAAADMEPNVVQYYRNNGGNVNGVPVQAISISVDLGDMVQENNFIATYGLELVGDDTGGAYSVYGDGYIPYMVVINATTNSTNFGAWRVLHSTSGYSRTAIMAAIDSVQTTPPTSTITSPVDGALVTPPHLPLSAAVSSNGKIIKRVEFYNGATLIGSKTSPPYSLTWSNAPLGTRTVFARAIFGTSSRMDSPPVTFTVGNPTPVNSTLSCQGNSMVLSWCGSPGLFRVQMATNLNAPVWQYLTPPTTNTTFVMTPTNSAAFYRIVRP